MYMKFLNFKKLLLILFIVVIPLLTANLSRNGFTESIFYKISSSITQGTLLFFSSYSRSIGETISHYLFLLQAKRDNYQLKNENAQLKIKLMQMEEIKKENDRLSQMIQFAQKKTFRLLPVRIIALDPFPDHHLITLNKGFEDGVKKNMGVVSEQGVVGYIFRVSSKNSQVLLLSDSSAVIPATVQRSRVSSLIEGSQQGGLQLKYIKNEDDVQIDDKVVTSGIDSWFPSGLPIGLVSEIKKDKYGINQKVKVRPFVSLSQIEELFVIVR